MKILFVVAALAVCFAAVPAYAIRPDLKTLPIGFAPFERGHGKIPPTFPLTPAPQGHVYSLAEWEESESIMTLWTNPALVRAYAAHGSVTLFADTAADQQWWVDWLKANSIDSSNVHYFRVPTDSMWVRDYGPWWILDGQGRFGIVDTIYNRPRPLDDQVPAFVAKELGVPLFAPGLVHTGGNYHSNGVGDAYSSTLVYSENAQLSKTEINSRMQAFLGIDRYTTSRLNPGVSIEHMDTYGKLVSPDTWVFGEFPAGSRFKADSDAMVALLKTLKSPYGTPFKIYRMPMILRPGSRGEDYRAYINAFISNGALYYATYGNDTADKNAAAIYQKAMPGYEIVGINATDTEWGDSIHCRSRNILKRDTIFLFPKLERRAGSTLVSVDAFASPGARLNSAPQIYWRYHGENSFRILSTTLNKDHQFVAPLPSANGAEFYIVATDSSGKTKKSPSQAPKMLIEY